MGAAGAIGGASMIPVVGGAGAGAIGGFLTGMEGTPDQLQYQDTTTTYDNRSKLNLDPLSKEQRQLQQQSLQSYLQQLALAQQYEQGLGGAQGYQDLARQQAMGVLSGQGLQATPQEQALIEQQRAAQVGQAQADVQRFLDQNLSGLSNQAGARGLRGQALSELQGRALASSADQLGNASRQAAAQAAQAQLNAPYQRLAAQSPFLQQGVSFADQMRIQAQQNRQAAQNPYLLGLLQQERIATGEQRQSGTNRVQGVSRTPGQEGSFGQGLLGALGGASYGASAGANILSGMNSLNQAQPMGGSGGMRSQMLQNQASFRPQSFQYESPNFGSFS